MYRLALLISTCIFVARVGVASPSADSDQAQAATQDAPTATTTAETAKPDAGNPEPATATVTKSAGVDTAESKSSASETNEKPADDAEIISVSEVQNVSASDEADKKPDLVCERVRRTGSHRAVRVCRTRGEIEQSSRDGKDAFEDFHRTQERQSEF